MSVEPVDVDLVLRSFVPRRSGAGGIASWAGHQPFAYLLVGELRPKAIVELGTYWGDSYFTFCQAIADFAIECGVTAVDTWRGDVHSGEYGDDVFSDVSAHNAEHYGSFSRLLRMTFDEALAQFPDASVDLLHIDGLHTYDAVKHDFESWLPKLRPGSVVLFHDIAEHRDDFGVWKLWEELADRYEHFAFDHGHGLGVIRLPGGPALPDGALATLFARDGSARRSRMLDQIAAKGRQLEDAARIRKRLRRRLERRRKTRYRIAVAAAAAIAVLALGWFFTL